MDFKKMIGFGVAGNFAGHLEQAGEASDFVNVKVKDNIQPKAIFPFYLPNQTETFLATFPVSSDTIQFPVGADNLQIEPEIALICEIEYDENKQVQALKPIYFTAFNDCSIRRPGAKKISEKKNWGPASKGMASQLLPLSEFSEGCELDHYRIASFLKRGGKAYPYGQDSAAVDYSYFHETLLNWVIEKMNHQADEGPAEDIALHLKNSGYPTQVIISIGATRYLPFGETTFLQPGDESIVVVYDSRQFDAEFVQAGAQANELSNQGGMCVLKQTVV